MVEMADSEYTAVLNERNLEFEKSQTDLSLSVRMEQGRVGG